MARRDPAFVGELLRAEIKIARMPPISCSLLLPCAIVGLLVFLGELLKPDPEDRKFAFFLAVGKILMYIAGGTISSAVAGKILKAVFDALKLRRATSVAEKASYLVALCFMLAVIHTEKKAAGFLSLLHVLAVILGIVQREQLRTVFFSGVQEAYFFSVLFYAVGAVLILFMRVLFDEALDAARKATIFQIIGGRAFCWVIVNASAAVLLYVDKTNDDKTDESGKSVAASLIQDTLGNESTDLFKTRTENIDGNKLIVKYAFGLTEPPDAREWHDTDSIKLRGNIFSNLPDKPECPKLLNLFLDNNYKLRTIPPAFFTNMPLLRTLDLSETGIMSLPKSLFELPHLGELILKNCEFLMKLPPEVGKLKRLEVLDMEGTEIINLPIEIKELSLLRFLRVSLYGRLDHDWKSRQSNAMIPFGVISTLSKLEDIYIDVNPDDERWDACVERILKEVCGLTKLTCLGFYFPRVELLSCLMPDHASIIHQLNFKLIVGGHSKRIISRIPSNVELELNTRYKYGCMKYINGEGVPEVIKSVLPYTTAFHLDRHMTARKLTEFGIENMDRLQYCVLGECNEMQVIIDGNDVDNRQIIHGSFGARSLGFDLLQFLHIYYMKNLKSIWEGPVDGRSLSLLKSLTLSTCPQLITIFTVELLENLRNLKDLTVRDCPAIKSLVSCEEGDKQSATNYLPELRTISLHYVPNLVSISSEVCIAPKLEKLSLYNCPKLKSLSIKEVSSKHLTKITGETDWWEALELTQVQRDKFDGIFISINVDTSDNGPIGEFCYFPNNRKSAGKPKDSLSEAQLQQSVDLDEKELNEKEQRSIEKIIQDGLRLKAEPESSKKPKALPRPNKGEESVRPEIEQYPTFDRQRQFISKCGLGLTESPGAEEWYDAEKIDLMDNKLSNLPDEPICPKLYTLSLRENYKLRKIPSTFFTNMPLLQFLDLSKTSIMSLPKSVFELAHLKRLYLMKCEFLMVLPPEVGKLKRLEVLDMEGTEIFNLPVEIQELSVLRRLRVSLYGCIHQDWQSKQSNSMIPFGVISALSTLQEVNIGVNPDDERWDACVETIMNEVCDLSSLKTLMFYFPRVELLRYLKWNHTVMISPSLSDFRFIVGHHSKRIISRLPSIVEFEFERLGLHNRCLKYINGEGVVPEEIKKVLKHATAFQLDRHRTVKKLTEFGIENMEHLKGFLLGECKEIQVIIDGNDIHNGQIVCESSGDRRIGLESLEFLYIYYMKNLKSIWEGPVDERSLSLLKSLTLSTCPQLITIFTVELLENLRNLKDLTVRDCPAIKSLVSCEEGAKQSASYLPELRTISLHYVPNLVSISSEVCIAPKLEKLSLYNCPKLKSLSIKEVSSKHLTKITGETDWWEALELTQVQRDKFDGIFVSINADTSDNGPIANNRKSAGKPKDSLSEAQLQQSVDLDEKELNEKEQRSIEKKIQDGLQLKAKPESSKQPKAIPCPDKGEESVRPADKGEDSIRPEIEQCPTFDRQRQIIYGAEMIDPVDNELSGGTWLGEFVDRWWWELADILPKMLLI